MIHLDALPFFFIIFCFIVDVTKLNCFISTDVEKENERETIFIFQRKKNVSPHYLFKIFEFELEMAFFF